MRSVGAVLAHVLCVLVGVQARDWDTYDEMFKKMMDCNPETASFAISAVKEGEVVFNNAYGKASLESNIPVSNSTRFSIGSITKEFTAYLAGSQVKKGDYTWTDKIVDVFAKHGIPFSLYGKYRSETATIEDAMTHRTGVKEYGWLLSDDRPFTRGQWVTEILPQFKQVAELRTVFYYNNWFYTMVGYLIELYGGKPYEELVRETLLDPLEMTDTCFVSDPQFDALSQADFSQPYQEGSDGTLYPIPKRAMKFITPHNPAGGLVSTSADMAKYMIAVIGGFNQEEGAVLDSEILASITHPKILMEIQLGDSTIIQKPQFPESFKDAGYAYGHIIGNYRGYRYVNHGGSTYGHYSFVTVIPDLKLGVFTVISGDDYMFRDNYRMQRLMHLYMFDKMMGLEPWMDAETACSFPEPWMTLPPPPASTQKESANKTVVGGEEYEGTYVNSVFPPIVISTTSDGLQFVMGNINGTVVPLETPLTPRTFAVVITMPVNPINLPESEKQRAYITFTTTEQQSDKISGLVLDEKREKFEFARSRGIRAADSFFFIWTIILAIRELYWL